MGKPGTERHMHIISANFRFELTEFEYKTVVNRVDRRWTERKVLSGLRLIGSK